MPTVRPVLYEFHDMAGPSKEKLFRVAVTYADGRQTSVGTVRYFYIPHMRQHGWEATGPDGHRAVHEHRWQAAWALTWNGVGYPFPVAASHRREVEPVRS